MSNNLTFSLDGNTFESVELYKNKDTFIDDKEKIKIIKNIEQIIRSSLEYKKYIKYVKQTNNMNKCSILNGINSDEDITLNVHHNIWTLFDYCDIVIKKFDDEGKYWNSFKIANEVIKLHYQKMISLVTISQTIHEYIHCNGIIINDDIYSIGNAHAFYELYYTYMTKEQLEKYELYTNSNTTLDDIKNSVILK